MIKNSKNVRNVMIADAISIASRIVDRHSSVRQKERAQKEDVHRVLFEKCGRKNNASS